MRLVIAEKNELARDIASALCGHGSPDDVMLPARGNGFTVCAASGHLLALVEPAAVDPRYARTDVEQLPISVYPWPTAPQGEYQAKKLKDIKSLVAMCDGEIFHAGDADDEGQLIVDEILEWCGVDPASPRVMRVYVNDNIPKNIRAAFASARPNAGCVQAGLAAKARALGDFCFGVNESRLATAKLGARVSVGRVQTPTLGLVVERDLARETHAKREYYELRLRTREEGPEGVSATFRYQPPEDALEDGRRCFDRDHVADVATAARAAVGRAFEVDVSVKEKALESPLPYNLTDLTADMSRRFKMTAADVMEATQALREKYKAITYNRAESRHLPVGHLGSAPAVIAAASGNIGWEGAIDASRRHAAFDDGKVGAHHGIIPQERALDLTVMPERERTVYTAIAQRYLCLFAPEMVYEVATARVAASDVPGLEGREGGFEYRANRVVEQGWAEAAPHEWMRVRNLVDALPSAGRAAFAVDDVEECAKTTSPPPAFTDGTLMVAMSNIARYVRDPEVKRILVEKDSASTTDHGSIGTVATRKDVIERLVARGFLERRGSSLVSTAKGRKFYGLVPEEIRGADLTARWYLIQKKVQEGGAAPDAVMRSVCEEFIRHRDSAYEGKSLQTSLGACPLCGKPVVARGKGYFACSSVRVERRSDGTYEDVAGCGFKLFGFGGKRFTEKQAAAILAGKAVTLKGCTSRKSGKKYDCKVRLGACGKVEPMFDAAGPGRAPRGAHAHR